MKTYAIELSRIHALHERHGMVHARVDALVQPAPRPRAGEDDADPGTTLSLTVENARVLFLLLKARLAEVDGRKGRSQR